jgi:hypothetical protein
MLSRLRSRSAVVHFSTRVPTIPKDPLRRHGAAGGFALPLAIAAALVVLLTSLASQSALHQARLRNAAALDDRQLEDGLASAAHRLVAQMVARHPCLLALPLEHWSQSGSACADAAQQAALREGQVAARAYRLLAWQPAVVAEPALPSVHLELVSRSTGGESAARAAFALDLQGQPPRVLGLRELGLRGTRP